MLIIRFKKAPQIKFHLRATTIPNFECVGETMFARKVWNPYFKLFMETYYLSTFS